MTVRYSDLTPGTAVVWMNTGGDKALNGKNLTNGSIREGAKSASLVDGTKGFPEWLEWTVETKVQSTPTDGTQMFLYLGFSSSATAGTDNPAGLTGADAAVGDTDQLALLPLAGGVVMAGSLTTGVQRQIFYTRPLKEYVIPVLYNATGQTTSNVDSETKVTMRPWYRRNPIT